MNDIAFKSAMDLAAMIREGQLSSCELVDCYLERISRYNNQLNAVVTLDEAGARSKARAADKARADGRPLGPLHGVPVTIKDGFETAGMRTTSGATILKDHIPSANAIAVQRYVDAGAIIMGKTNVPTYCADAQSYNEIFGVTNNPWDLSRTPGGSSGGAAAALAAGLSALEIGSDIAGSIRVPAAWSGVYGHRPTYGIVPFIGHIPPPPGITSQADLSVAGPMARSARDLALALGILAGPTEREAVAWQLHLPKPRAAALGSYRIAAWLEHESVSMDADVAACLNETVEALRSAGANVDEKARPSIEFTKAIKTYTQLLNPIMASGLPSDSFELLKQMATTDKGDSQLGQFAVEATQLHREWLSANARREKHRRIWARFFEDYDILLCPAASIPAIPHNTEGETWDRTVTVNGKPAPYADLLTWAGLVTYVYLPVTSAPVGRTRNGLPVGIQIVGPYLEDYTTIDFAQRLSEIIGGFTRPPDFS